MVRANLLTVSASLQEAQLLALSQSVGKLAVVVRNPDDQRVTESPPNIGGSELFDVTARLAVQSSRRRTTPVRLEVERHP
jgi:hypothetical protein